MSQIEVAGLRIAYERAGDGPPLVLLNGYVGDGAATWRHQIEELSDEFTVVAWDSPGSGRSSDPPEWFRLADYADCLAEFMVALGLGEAHVAGLSFGGAIAIEFYRRHPTIPKTLSLASAYAGWAGSLPADVVQQRLQQALDLAGLTPDRLVRALLPTMFSDSVSAETLEAFGASIAQFHPAGLRAMARSVEEADLRAVLPDVRVPTLLLYGDKDARAPLSVAEAIHDALPASRLVVMPGVGHASSVEAPQAFNGHVRDFLHDARLTR